MKSDSETQFDTEDEATFSHIPVLSREVIEGLAVHPGGHYLDATVGGGGHSRLILEAAPDVQLTAMDQDEDALIAAKKQLGEFGVSVAPPKEARIQFIKSNFAAYRFPPSTFSGILADLGVSSYHLDTASRGFSFRSSAPLDMRMDRGQSLTASTLR